jgi:CysZ protein
MRGNPGAGARYLWRGFGMLTHPELRRYVAIPLLLNLVIFGALFGAGWHLIEDWTQQLLALLPAWLRFLQWILWPLTALLVLVIAAYACSACANIVAAPFNALLAEQVEAMLLRASGQATQAAPPPGLLAAIADAPRSIGKEIRKLFFYIPRALLIFVLSLLPPLYPFAPLMWFALGAWMLALEYCDYPMDNHRYTLLQVRTRIASQRLTTYGFGAATLLGSMVPLLNLVVMPAAVCGATLYWTERLRPPAEALPRK